MQRLVSLKLQEKIILLVCGVVLVALTATGWVISHQVAEDTKAQIGNAVMYVARIVAQSDTVVEGLNGKRSGKDVQDYANNIRHLTKYAVVVVFDMDGMRKSHPDAAKLGYHIVGGDEDRALAGEEYLSIAKGTMGPQLRAFTPVYDGDKQIGAVVVGMHLHDVEQAVADSRKHIFMTTLLGLAIGVAGAVILARSIKRTLFGLEPAGIAKLLEERNEMLYSVKEGVLAVDQFGRLTIVNEAAEAMLANAGIEGDLVGNLVDDVVPNTGLSRVLNTGQPELQQEQDLSGIRILTNRVPIKVNGTIVGAIATFRDKTEVNQLAEELTGVRGYVEALRSQAHEFMNKLHVILGLVQLESYEQLAMYIQRIANDQETEVGLVGRYIKDPVIAGLVLSKLSRSRELGVNMKLAEESALVEQIEPFIQHELVTIIGNLLDNALEAVSDTVTKDICISIKADEAALEIVVEDSGCGLAPTIIDRVTEKGFSTKSGNRGFGLYLVNNSVNRLGGRLEFTGRRQGAVAKVLLPKWRTHD